MSSAETTSMRGLRELPAWQALSEHFKKLEPVHLRDLFAQDPARGERFTAEGAGLFLDFSKNRITEETVDLLVQLAEQAGLSERTQARRCIR